MKKITMPALTKPASELRKQQEDLAKREADVSAKETAATTAKPNGK